MEFIVSNFRDMRRIVTNPVLFPRPTMPMMNDLYVASSRRMVHSVEQATLTLRIGFDWHLGFMEYGSKWKGGIGLGLDRQSLTSKIERRSLLHQVFHPSRMHHYRPAALAMIKTLLGRLLADPTHYFDHAQWYVRIL